VLHHLDVPQALREIVRVSKPGARMWFSEPNMLNPQIMLQKNIRVLKRLAGDTPHETAFFRWAMSQALRGAGLTDVRVMPFDFMHPWIPDWATNVVDALGRMVEHIPGVREFAGSLVIHARKPL
ncbi:MAG TPA: hypothetical protein VMU17_01735, partial [Elusimicrobiota bacterium]|nr:hypothetical protein [Elusimicrobiota bacterium]